MAGALQHVEFCAGSFAQAGRRCSRNFDAGAIFHRLHEPPVDRIAGLLTRAFGARITDTVRPASATYGARLSWHKVGQAIDFVPAGGVASITREGIRALMDANGVRIIELLGPGDPGHSNHWHLAFARPGRVTDQPRPVEGDEDWMVDVARSELAIRQYEQPDAPAAPAPASSLAERTPPSWDVFAAAAWRAAQGGGS